MVADGAVGKASRGLPWQRPLGDLSGVLQGPAAGAGDVCEEERQ